MPSLHIFGRGWSIASDDFVFPALSEGLIRFTWFVAAFILYTLPDTTTKCEDGMYLGNYILILLVLNALLFMVCIAMSIVSGRGTILNSYPRRHLAMLIYLRCPLFVCEVCINIFGTIAISGKEDGLNITEPIKNCSERVFASVVVTVIAEWGVILVFIVGLYLVFDPLGTQHGGEHSLARDRSKKIWRRRIRWLCCCANADDNAKAAFEDVADLMTDFFGDLELVPTDVWAGLVLLASRDVSIMSDARPHEPAPPLIKPHLIKSRPSWMTLSAASRMMQFSMAVYGWPYYVWNSCGLQPWMRLLKALNCCQKCRCDQVLIVRDNCCECNTAAFRLSTNLSPADVFYVSFRNQIFETPFVACADPETKSIVIALRGSMSLRDAITDLTMAEDTLPLHYNTHTQEELPVVLNADGTESPANENIHTTQPENAESSIRVHRGMLQSAKYVVAELDKQNVLEDMFVLYPSYELVITGHSLGAGVAVLVAMLLRQRYPGVRVFAFSPPGCVVNTEGLAECSAFVCSVVIGDDLVPRMSYESMQRLKQDILELIQECHLPKYQILLHGCFRLVCGQQPAESEHLIDNNITDLEAPPPDPDVSRQATPGYTPSPTIGRITSESDNNHIGLLNAEQPMDVVFSTPPSSFTHGPAIIATRSISVSSTHDPLVNERMRLASTGSNYGSNGTDPIAVMDPSPTAGASASVNVVDNASVSTNTLTVSALNHNTQRALLYCPGHIMHLSRSPLADHNHTPLVLNWTDHRRFRNIKLSYKMVTDHWPTYMCEQLNRTCAHVHVGESQVVDENQQHFGTGGASGSAGDAGGVVNSTMLL